MNRPAEVALGAVRATAEAPLRILVGAAWAMPGLVVGIGAAVAASHFLLAPQSDSTEDRGEVAPPVATAPATPHLGGLHLDLNTDTASSAYGAAAQAPLGQHGPMSIRLNSNHAISVGNTPNRQPTPHAVGSHQQN